MNPIILNVKKPIISTATMVEPTGVPAIIEIINPAIKSFGVQKEVLR